MLIHRNATHWLPVRRIRGLFALDSIKKKNTEIINMDPVLSACVGGLYQAATLIPNILFICIPRAKGHADMGLIERDVIRIWKAMFTPSMIRSQDITLLFTPGNMHVRLLWGPGHIGIFSTTSTRCGQQCPREWKTEYFATYWNNFYMNALKQWTSRTEFNCCKYWSIFSKCVVSGWLFFLCDLFEHLKKYFFVWVVKLFSVSS